MQRFLDTPLVSEARRAREVDSSEFGHLATRWSPFRRWNWQPAVISLSARGLTTGEETSRYRLVDKPRDGGLGHGADSKCFGQASPGTLV